MGDADTVRAMLAELERLNEVASFWEQVAHPLVAARMAELPDAPELGGLQRWIVNDGRDLLHRLRREEVESVAEQECTGVAAGWCPVHGDCTCPRDEDGALETTSDGYEVVHDDACPLHGIDSKHAEAR